MAVTIGIIIDQLVYEYQAEFWHGICAEAQRSGVNLISFVGSTLDYAEAGIVNRNKIYNIISSSRIDGAIILSSSVLSRVNSNEKKEFISKISSYCPVVSVGDMFKEYASIGIDNRRGMYDSVNHMIKKHGKKRIAFIGGPETSEEAVIRFNAYKEALADNNISFDSKLYYEGKFIFDSGVEAVEFFANNKIDFDGVVAANDGMAFGAIHELKRRNLEVPGKIAVAGFDNVESAYVSNPPLSSVKQPLYNMGMKALTTIVDIIENRPYEMSSIFPTEHIIRDSCGCLLTESTDDDETSAGSFSSSFNFPEIKSDLIEKIRSDCNGSGTMHFLHHFNSVLAQISRTEDIIEFHDLISEMRDELISPEALMGNDATYGKAFNHSFIRGKEAENILRKYCLTIHSIENHLHKARSLITRRAEQLQFVKYLNTNHRSSQIIEIGQNLLTAYTMEHLLSVIKNSFPTVDINLCAIVLFDDEASYPISKTSKVIFQYDGEKEFSGKDNSFETVKILPDNLWLPDRMSPWLANVIPLNHNNETVGYVLYESKNLFGLIYEAFTSEIASALKGIDIYKENEIILSGIKERSKKINTLVMPMLESIQQVALLSEEEIKSTKELSSITSTGLDQLKSSNEIIEKTSESIAQMVEMIHLIENLSDSINILALNASIESARAGKYGLGFQVISTEVKELSDTTAKNTKSILEVLNLISNNIKDSNNASRKNYMVFSDLKNHVIKVTDLFQNITGMMNELSKSSNEILSEIEKKI
jgi:DNA-binding LacI/PurR family transcriptional regulator